jgi:glycosyltransferase involved in cell wall biosynthesis
LTPNVTFVVPSYQLAHFLPECVHSILAQTYQDFEILILDDCSTDRTPEVAQALRDPRVKYIRNEVNLGHLRNYNKGIGLAQGKYVWLISADDCIRRPYALERYVSLMEEHPEVGYVFCSAVGLQNAQETGLLDYSSIGDRDTILDGREFLLTKLLGTGCIVAPTVMVRKECYEKISVYALDMPHQGDIYLWCLFALRYNVAFFSEPMVSYRRHDMGMEVTLKRKDPGILFADNLAVLWRTKRAAEQAGLAAVAARCCDRLVEFYRYRLETKVFDTSTYGITREEFERSLRSNASNSQEIRKIRAKVYAGLGDRYYRQKQFESALQLYAEGLFLNVWTPELWLKYGLLRLGAGGIRFREGISALHHFVAERKSAGFRSPGSVPQTSSITRERR